jgi:cellulose biosynthesis protein BcsQ
MGARVICMASAKGGSGKTILTATFGALLASVGKSVLLIDTDASTNGLTLLYLKEVRRQGEFAVGSGTTPKGVYEGVSRATPPTLVALDTGVNLIPATYGFKNTETTGVDEFRMSLVNSIDLFRQDFDFIFLDAQAGSDQFAKVAMSRGVSDEVVIVSEYDPLSAAGVERLKGLLREELTYDRTWVLLNKMLPDFVQSFSDFLEVAKYASPIPWDATVVRAYARRRLATDFEYGNDFTLAVIQTLKSLWGEQIGQDLSAWIEKRASLLRQPLKTQYEDAETELKGLLAERRRFEMNERRQRIIFQAFALTVSFVGVAVSFYLKELKVLDSALLWPILTIAVGLLVFAPFFLKDVVSRRSTVESDVDFARITRQTELLNARLKNLEALKAADAETVLRSRGAVFERGGLRKSAE